MAKSRKPVPKSQVELSQETIQPYLNQGKSPVPANKRRENQRSVKGDDVKQFQVGLKDIDAAIFYYFDKVIRPSVIQNTTKINVPVLYGSPEKWAAVQKDGYYRDHDGKIQAPLIMFKRDSVEKDRTKGNKMDANNPNHFGIFEKKYSKKNVYDRFSALLNREEVKEYYGVIMPDYVNLVYSCTIFTQYVEQMNKIVESINYASDSYWGDPERFQFRAAIDTYTTITEQTQGEDRVVRTTFQIKIAGYIVPDAINTSIANPNKFFSKAAVSFGIETAGTSEILNAKAASPVRQAPRRFYEATGGGGGRAGMTAEQITYIGLNSTATADILSGSVATFIGRTIFTPPAGFLPIEEADFQVYINGVFYLPDTRTTTQLGSNMIVTFVDYTFDPDEQVVIIGKFT